MRNYLHYIRINVYRDKEIQDIVLEDEQEVFGLYDLVFEKLMACF